MCVSSMPWSSPGTAPALLDSGSGPDCAATSCGCSSHCLCCCRREKIKYFSFRSFTQFTSRERDAPESQVRLAEKGRGAAGCRELGWVWGQGRVSAPCQCGATVTRHCQGQPGHGQALRAGRGKVQEVAGQPALPRAVTLRSAGSWGCRLGLPRCWGHWVPCAVGDSTSCQQSQHRNRGWGQDWDREPEDGDI